MRPGEFARRIVRLYRLLWVDDRISALDRRADLQQEALRMQEEALRMHQEALRNHGRILDNRTRTTVRQIELLKEQLDLLKSSLDVPPELVEGFADWKVRSPVPERPLVSVVVATYNRAEALVERCIPSVLGQTYDNLELIVVGDGCTDGTEEAVSGIEDPRLRFFNLPERSAYPEDPRRRWLVAGTPPTNKALSMAKGDFVAQLDDDDEFDPRRLEKLVPFAVENGYDFVWHPFWERSEDGGWRLVEAHHFAYGQVTNASSLYRAWFKNLEADAHSHLLMEPGDWNRFRKIKYISSMYARYPEPLLKKY